MELRRYMLITRRWSWLIVLATLIAAAAAYGVSRRAAKQYRATATLIINQGQQAGTTYSDVLASQQLAKSYATVATSRPVLSTAAAGLGLGPGAVSSTCACLVNGRSTILRVSADVPANTQLITVSATSGSAKFAAAGANAVAVAFSDAITQAQLGDGAASVDSLNQQIQAVQGGIQKTTDEITALGDSARTPIPADSTQLSVLQSQLAQEQATYATLTGQLAQIKLAQSTAVNAVKVVEPAVAPAAPFSPRTSFNVILAAFLALLVSSGLALLLEYLDDRVQSPEDVETAAGGAATLGVIEKLDPSRDESGVGSKLLLCPDGGFSTAHEEYRLLRSNLEFAVADRRVKTLVVTSARASEGKSTTAANLAIVLAQAGRRVLLVDADMRRPTLHRLFGLPNEAGFSLLFLLTEATELDPLLNQTRYDNLQVMTGGLQPPNPTELLSSGRMRQLVTLLSEKADIVIFDSSPILAVADAAEIAARVDGVLMVVDASKTRPSELALAHAALNRASASLLGVVLNKLQRKQTRSGYHYYAYGEYRPRKTVEGEPRRQALGEARATTAVDSRCWVQVKPAMNGQNGHSRQNGQNGHHQEGL